MDDQNQPLANSNPPANADPKQQIAERLKKANNVLVTVSNNPSVDQLAACIGLTLILNKMDKHATAVFSGKVPSTIEFLQPEQTLEKTTDSLRDFIISLDKAKADKLRYKVEDRVVKIFITPYRTSINEKDLEFSQGDFNVDIVVAIGVHEQKDLDQAITAHGRILHDAVVTTISTATPSTLGTINWQDSRASSLSELVTSLDDNLGPNLMDGQIATALLTGIVAETDRFSNDKTSPRTMSASAALMSAGANQQLVATKLQAKPESAPDAAPKDSAHDTPVKPSEPPKPKDILEITHEEDDKPVTSIEELEAEAEALRKEQQIHIDNEGKLHRLTEDQKEQAGQSAEPKAVDDAPEPPSNSRTAMQEPPRFNGTLTSEAKPEADDPTSDALSLPKVEQPILSHSPMPVASSQPDDSTPQDFTPPPPAESEPPKLTAPEPNRTLGEIEQSIDSPHMYRVDASPPPTPAQEPPDLDSLRNVVDQAATNSEPLPTPAAFNSQMLGDNINAEPPLPPAEPALPSLDAQPPTLPQPPAYVPEAAPGPMPSDQPPTMQLPTTFPPSLIPPTPANPQPFTNAPSDAPMPPPPVPPPFQFGPPPSSPQV